MSLDFQNIVETAIWQNYPDLQSHPNLAEKILTICTNHKIELSKSVLASAQKYITSFFNLRNSKEYQSSLDAKRPGIAFDPKNFSVLMGYDFHLTSDNQLKLIEINTNAASSLLVEILYQAQGKSDIGTFFHENLKASFREEFNLCENIISRKVKNIALIDENYKEQNSYFEFLMFKSLFTRWGFNCLISEPDDFEFDGKNLKHKSTETPIDFIYNRLTDFYLSSPKCKAIHDAYLTKAVGLSPNPHEYFLLADKNRLIELSKKNNTEFNCLLETLSFRDFSDPEQLWAKRKKYFFKPTGAYGGRGAFKGESISRKIFNEIFEKDYLAQEYVSPPTVGDLKWDLRFYVYKDIIQLSAARLYKGQTTNFKSPGTGLGIVTFN